ARAGAPRSATSYSNNADKKGLSGSFIHMATSSYLRRMNQRRIIESVVRLRKVSRAELARAAGMSQPTVSRIVDELLSGGILMQSETDSETVPAQKTTGKKSA